MRSRNTAKTRRRTSPPSPPPDEMALEAEFGAIQSGRLNLEQAPTFNRIAIERGQSVHQIYNETFARESRRLQDEEEEQVNREIDQFIAKFPKIFSLPKRKELINQIRDLLTNAKSEKYGKLDEGNGWTCLENNDHTYLVSSKVQGGSSGHALTDATALIGQNVVTENGKEGKLICGSGMGVTPIDVFNEIMTKPADLRHFLGEENWRESETLALRNVFVL